MHRLTKTIRLTWYFYRSYCPASLLITAACTGLLWRTGFVNPIFFGVFWFKLITLGIIFYFMNGYRKKEYFYYRNLGVSEKWLWTATLSFDFILFIFCLVMVQTG